MIITRPQGNTEPSLVFYFCGRFAIEHCLKHYGNVITSDAATAENGMCMALITTEFIAESIMRISLYLVYYELSEEKVCQFYAELLLRPAGKVGLKDMSA